MLIWSTERGNDLLNVMAVPAMADLVAVSTQPSRGEEALCCPAAHWKESSCFFTSTAAPLARPGFRASDPRCEISGLRLGSPKTMCSSNSSQAHMHSL